MSRPTSARSRIPARVCVWVVLLSAACASTAERSRPGDGLDRRFGRFTFVEEGRLVTFAVNTEAARRRDGAALLPLAIAVANDRVPRLTLRRESLTLVDDQGRRYPMATVREVNALRPSARQDLRLSRIFASTFGRRFVGRSPVGSVFFPIQVSDPAFSGRGLVSDVIVIPRLSWTIDVVYFPSPAGSLLGRRYELWLEAPELEQPVFVKFAIE